ncbi:MAG: tetraacyldisaccharide 4'-kinase [Phycisphaerales bacterium]|nr:tetraacyldisaccharide 4'-kinase [Phycisphaerales bacterium]
MSNQISNRHDSSPTRLPRWISRPLSWLYRVGIGFENRRYNQGIGVSKLDIPVISVGNLSAGGTGKTPMVHWVVKIVQEMGVTPLIAMRGYGARPGELSDEEQVHQIAFPDVLVVAQPDRVAGIQAHLESGSRFDIVILDDGFQHRRVARDLDFVLIDASHPPYVDSLLPRGFLREPISSLDRADAIVITHRELVSENELNTIKARIQNQLPSCPIAVASHEWRSAQRFDQFEDCWVSTEVGIEEFEGVPVFAACGIGNPEGFYASIKSAGWDLVDSQTLKDHHEFDLQTIETILNKMRKSELKTLVMTQKDWVKASKSILSSQLDLDWPISIVVPELGFKFWSGEEKIRTVVQQALCASNPKNI